MGSNLARLAAAWDDARMDCLMMLALASTSHGYQGRGDFALESDGRIRRRAVEQEIVPFAFTGVSIAHPRLFDGSPEGAFSLNVVWSRAIAAGRAYGMRMDGVWMHVGTPEALARSRAVPERRCVESESKKGAGVAQRGASTRFRRAAVPDGAGRGAAGGRPAGARAGARPGPLQLADITLLLPTRRATRALQEAFLKASGGAALLLPKIRPIIGAAEEDLGALASADDFAADAAGELRPRDQRHRAAAGARQAGHGVVRGERGRGRTSPVDGARTPRRRPGWRASSPG